MTIIQRVPWRVQPQTAVGPRKESSLLDGMLGLYTPTYSKKNIVGVLGDLTTAGTATLRPSTGGVGYYGGSSSNYWALPDIYARTHHGVGTGEVTLIAIIKSNTTGDQGFPFQTTDAGTTDHYPYAGVIYASVFSTTRWASGVAFKVPITSQHVLIVRSRVGEKNMYQNGLLVASGTGNTYSFNSGGIHVGKAQTSGFDGQIELVGVLDRYITDAEVALLRSPAYAYGELFAPLPRRIWAPSAAGGAYTLTADAGSYAIAGQDATLLKTRIVVADAGAYAVAGQDAALKVGHLITADAGAYSVSGQDATLLRGRVVTADAGAYAVDGQDATLSYAGASTYTLTCDAGGYALAGQAATLLLNRVMTADPGAYSIEGQDAAFSYSGAGSQTNSGGWPMPVRRKKKKPDDEELTPEVVEAVAEAPKERRTITLQQLIGKRAAAQVDAAELSQAIRTLRLKKRQREDEELMLM